jgi:uncharacterized membrane protein (UPF0182 family)
VTYERDPRGPRPVLQKRRRGALAPTLIALGALIVVGLIASQLSTEVLWYQQLGFVQVYRIELLTRTVLFILGGLLMGVSVAVSLLIGYRSRPIYAPVSAEQAGLDRYRESIEPLRRLVSVAVPVILGLFAGSAASQEWQQAQLWLHRVPFGTKDPQFHMDNGFFVFTLPWLEFVVGFLTAVVLLSAIAALVTHYLYGGLRLQGAGQRLTSAARVHLSVLAGVFLILRGLDYWLGRFALSTKDSRLITGLTYTDAHAVLTARGVLAGIAVIIAILFFITAFVDRWRLIPLYGVALLVVSAIVIGGIYPTAVQRFQVTPSARTKEAPYIQKNIKATRDAYGLSNVETTNFPAKTVADPALLRDSAETIPGIRLQDPALVSPTFGQLQQIKQYYAFPDSLDVDRYTIGGVTRDTVIATRELNINAAPAAQRNWVNDHTFYTHGFGVVAAYGNQRTDDGKPVFFQQGIPSTGSLGAYEPRIYFGERSPDYSIVGAAPGAPAQELDFPDDNNASGQQNNTYNGKGGVSIGSPLRKLLYAIKFQDQNILLSNQVNKYSKILYDRSPRQRVQKVAPFLTLDGDPYPAVVDGRIKWILDGYTTTSHYPYSSTQSLRDATSDSITEGTTSVRPLDNENINYIRNSVKATVDAYDGTVTLYTWDDKDPVLKAWTKVFPNVVKPITDIDGELMSHLRYPEDLFKVQREMLQKYHVSDAGAFFGQQDFWAVPDDPTRGAGLLQPPYYLTLQMPGQTSTSFSLTSTFVPTGRTRSVLTGFLAVDADAGSDPGKPQAGYGQLRLLQLPRDTVISGPGQVQNTFNSDPNVSTVLNLLQQTSNGTQSTTKVERGNLLTLPLAGGLLYVQPVYVRSSGANSYPLLQKVLVAFGDKIGFANDLDSALDQVFGTSTSSGSGSGTQNPPSTGGGTPTAAQARVQTALAAATAALKDSAAALKAGDFAAYGAAQKRLSEAVQDAVDAENAAATGTKSTPKPSTSASATPSATASALASALASASASATPTPTK